MMTWDCFQVSLDHEILLHPRYFGPQLIKTVRKMLFNEVEGKCIGKYVMMRIIDLETSSFHHRYGYVIAVTSIDNVGVGKIQPGTKHILSIEKRFAQDFHLST